MKLRLTKLFSVFLLLFSTFNLFATEYNSKFNILYLDDSTNPLDLDKIQTLPDGMFADYKEARHRPQHLDFSVWYKIELIDPKAEQTEPLSFTVDNPTLDFIKFHLVEDNQLILDKTVGDQQELASEADYVVPQLNVFDGVNSTQTIYIYVKTNGASASPILIESINDSELRSGAQLLMLGGFVGVILIMVIYNFSTFRGIGDPSYINYIGYIIFGGLTISMINGFTFFVLPFDIARWMHEHMLISHFCGLAFAIRFAISFLRFSTIKPWFVQLGIFLAHLNFLLAASALFFSEASLTPIYFACVGIVYLYAIILMSKVIGENIIWVKYYLLSWIPLFVGVGVGIAAFNGGIEYNFLTRNAAMLGVLSEICIMAIALMDRFRVTQLDKDYKTHHDSITGLPNQVALNLVLEQLIRAKKTFTLATFKITEPTELFSSLDMNSVNKLFKELLHNIEEYSQNLSSAYKFSRNLQSEVHQVIRLSDDSFAMLFLGDLPDKTLIYNTGIIQEAVSSVLYVNGAGITPKSVASLVSYPTDSLTSEHLMFLAKQTLLTAQLKNKKYFKFDDIEQPSSGKDFELAGELQSAITNNDLQLYHQPQISLTTGKVVGSELLLRWNHNEKGYIDPCKIVQVAEATGVIHQLTEWVIKQGFDQHSKLLKLGFEHTVSINLSTKDINNKNLINYILMTIISYEVPADTVIFEISEQSTIHESEQVTQVINELYVQGFKISIDDLGAKHSNIKQLIKLPLHQIKLSRIFMELSQSSVNKSIIEMLIHLCAKLGIQTIGEDIESIEAAELFKSLHFELGQGFYYAEPMAFLDYMRWLQNKPLSDEHKLF